MQETFKKDTRWVLLAGLTLVCLSVVVYIPAMRGDFIWDDDFYIVRNPLLRAPDGLYKIWFSMRQPSQYFPMVYTSFLLEYKLWGLEPFGYHITNIILHTINSLLLWLFFHRLGFRWGWIAAVIFAVHPLHVESVAWITERKNVLMMFFSMLSLLAWLGFLDNPGRSKRSWLFYVLALLLYAFALFSKATACMLPIAFVLMLWLKNITITARWLLKMVPFVLFSLAMGTAAMIWEYTRGAGGLALKLNYLERFLLAAKALWFYLGKLFWPAKLTFSYPKWNIDVTEPGQYVWLVLWVIVAWSIWRWRDRIGRAAIAAIVFFVAMPIPTLGFFSLYTFYYTYVADHYVYFATAGPIGLTVGIAWLIAGRLGRGGRIIAVVVSAAVVVALSGLTLRQCYIYRDLETLWRDTIAKNPQSYMAYDNLGVLFMSRGQVDEAIGLFQKALQIEPNDGDVHYNFAIALKKKGMLDEAISHYQRAAELEPDRRAEMYNSLGVAMKQKGELTEAIKYYRMALEINNRDAMIYYNLGNALVEQHQLDEAADCYYRAIELSPDFAGSYNNLGILLENQGKFEEAIDLYRKGLEAKPDDAVIRNNFVGLLVSRGKVDEAFWYFRSRADNEADAHFEFAMVLSSMERVGLAVEQLRKALELAPDWPAALASLAKILISYPRSEFYDPAEAVVLAERADALTAHQDANVLVLLSEVYAAAGRFDKAIETADDALAAATRDGNKELANYIRSRMQSYMEQGSVVE